MLRDRQEKEQLVRKFEEFFPFLKSVNNFGWVIPKCDADPEYRLFPDTSSPHQVTFRPVTVNLKTGWHSEFVYYDDGAHRVAEGIADVDTSDWSDYCYISNCTCKDN